MMTFSKLSIFGLMSLIIIVTSYWSHAEAAVIGIDLGSEFIKVGSVRGKNGVEIVLNEQTRRKSNNYVGFRGNEMFVGEDAKNFAPRFPNNMITMLNRIIGVSYDDVETREWYSKEMFLTYNLIRNERRGTIDIRLQNNPNTTHDVDTMMAFIFSYIKKITMDYNDGYVINDAVVVIPRFFTMRQRQSLVAAAKLGGVNIIGTIHTTTAIALQYAIQNRGFNESVDIVIYDMGATHTEIGVYTISPPEKGASKKDSMGVLTTRYIGEDRFLGARTFDSCLAREFANQFKEKSKIDVLSVTHSTEAGRKASVVLMRSANKVREVLSANKNSPVSVEGIAEDTDFAANILREDYEKWCSPLFERVKKLTKDVIEKSGIDLKKIHAFELHGGGTRMPRIQSDLQEIIGKMPDRTLNGDEAAAIGATYYAARLSGTFVIRGFALKEKFPYNVTFQFSPKPDSDAKAPLPAERPLFTDSPLPSRKSISVNRTSDFNVTFRIGDGKEEAMVSLRGIPNALTSLGYDKEDKNINNSHTVRVEVRLSESGVLSVTEAGIKYHEYVNASKKVKVKAASSSEKLNITNTSEGNATTEGGDGDGELAEGSDSTKGSNTSEGMNETATTTENKTNSTNAPVEYQRVYFWDLKKRNAPVAFEIDYADPKPMNQVEIEKSMEIIKVIEESEAKKHATSSAKNALETLIVGINVDYLDRFEGFMNQTEEEHIRAVAAQVREWIEDGDGSLETTTKEEFLNKTEVLNEALSSVVNKQKAHFDAIEAEKAAEAKKALDEEKKAKKNKEKEKKKKEKEKKKKEKAEKEKESEAEKESEGKEKESEGKEKESEGKEKGSENDQKEEEL